MKKSYIESREDITFLLFETWVVGNYKIFLHIYKYNKYKYINIYIIYTWRILMLVCIYPLRADHILRSLFLSLCFKLFLGRTLPLKTGHPIYEWTGCCGWYIRAVSQLLTPRKEPAWGGSCSNKEPWPPFPVFSSSCVSLPSSSSDLSQ